MNLIRQVDQWYLGLSLPNAMLGDLNVHHFSSPEGRASIEIVYETDVDTVDFMMWESGEVELAHGKLGGEIAYSSRAMTSASELAQTLRELQNLIEKTFYNSES